MRGEEGKGKTNLIEGKGWNERQIYVREEDDEEGETNLIERIGRGRDRSTGT